MRQGKTGDWEDRGRGFCLARGCYKSQLFVDLCFRYVIMYSHILMYPHVLVFCTWDVTITDHEASVNAVVRKE